MALSFFWRFPLLVLSLLYMGIGVRCNCPGQNITIEGGHYTLTDGLKYGSRIIYSCSEGYYPYPALTRSCQYGGSWNPPLNKRSTQICQLIECPDPNVLEYGSVFPPQEKYFVNNETTYECYSGYQLRGSSTRVCQPNSKWSGGTPICSRDSEDRCADPGIPAGARRTGHIFSLDTKVTYSCNDGLVLVGSKERVCQDNGQWTGTEPQCYYKHTYDTPLEVTEAFGSSLRESLTSLENNITQDGKRISVDKGDKLNIYIALDISDSIKKADFLKLREVVNKLVKKIASFAVTPNYEIILFSSEIKEIVDIVGLPGHKKKTLQEILEMLNSFDYDERQAGGTDLNLAFATILEKISLLKAQDAKNDYKNFKELSHVIIFFTDGVYNTGGSPRAKVAEIKQAVYMNEEKERETLLDIYAFGVGNDVDEGELMGLVTQRNDEQHFFKLKDITELGSTFDQIIDESNVVGLCGLHRDYVDQSTYSTQRMYPWLANIITRHTDTGKVSYCLGSLVTPQFVLTAAHCFRFGDTAKNIKVEITLKEKDVKRYFVHSEYNITAKVKKGINEFYDYDVALIQLEEELDISINVRPICIPCTLQTNEALKLTGDSSCKKQEEVLLKGHREEVSFLTKQKSIILKKNAIAKLLDQREDCIRHAIGVEGIKTEKATDVVTDNFLCTGGRDNREHIACRGDSGGAVFKNYEHRTIQVAIVSWGTKELCLNNNNMVDSDDTSRDFHINLFKVVPFLKKHLGNDDQDEYAPLKFL